MKCTDCDKLLIEWSYACTSCNCPMCAMCLGDDGLCETCREFVDDDDDDDFDEDCFEDYT